MTDHRPTPEQEAPAPNAFTIGFDLEDALQPGVPHHSGNHSGYLSGHPRSHHKQTLNDRGGQLDVEGRDLEDVYADERVVSRLFEFLEIKSQHQDWNKHGRAFAWMNGQANPLPAVYAARKGSTRVRKMSRQEHAAWGRRLLHDAGFLKPWPVGARRLPDTIADDAPERLVYEGFLLLLGLTWQVFPERPVLFSRDFAAPWCGVSERHFRMAWAWLQEAEYVGLAGWVKVGPWYANLWLPRAEA